MSDGARIRVLVIDDSAFSRQTITRMLESSPLVEVVGVARDGEEALRKTFQLNPDLITLDLEMPRMDGFTFLRLVMIRRATPVIVITGRAGQEEMFRALELGAVDFIAKPSPAGTAEIEAIQQELIRKVHAVRHLRIDKVRDRLAAAPALTATRADLAEAVPRLVAIGSSTGGPAAIMRILGSFSEAPPCSVLIAQHMPEGFTRSFAQRIDRLTPFQGREAQGGEVLGEGLVLVAPGGGHLELESRDGRVVARVVPREPGDKYTPSVDRTFEAAAKHFGSELLAVVLTGMGDDGRRGVSMVKQSGGRVIAESEETAVIFGMPKQAIRTGAVDAVLPLDRIAGAIYWGLDPADAPVAGERERA